MIRLTKTLIISLAILGLIILLEVALTIGIPYVKAVFFDSLTQKVMNSLLIGISCYGSVILAISAVQGIKTYVCHRTGLLIRMQLVNYLTSKLPSTTVTVPCARINEDTRIATDIAIQVLVEIIISAMIVIGLLITMATTPLLLASAVIYSVIAIVVALAFRRPLIDTKYKLQTNEGLHRKALVELDKPHKAFIGVITSYLDYIWVLCKFTLYSRIQNGVASIIPLLILAPLFISGGIDLGQLMGSAASFELMVINFTILVQLYGQVTEAQTSIIRLKEMI